MTSLVDKWWKLSRKKGTLEWKERTLAKRLAEANEALALRSLHAEGARILREKLDAFFTGHPRMKRAVHEGASGCCAQLEAKVETCRQEVERFEALREKNWSEISSISAELDDTLYRMEEEGYGD